MKKEEQFTKQSTQNPGESRKKNIKRIKKEKKEKDNFIKKEDKKSDSK